MTTEQKEASKVGLRFNEGKLAWHLVDFPALEPMVRVLMYGAEKYLPNNWKKGMPLEEILDCGQRHLAAIYSGEMNDKESGLPHIGHLICNAMFYSYFTETEAGRRQMAEMPENFVRKINGGDTLATPALDGKSFSELSKAEEMFQLVSQLFDWVNDKYLEDWGADIGGLDGLMSIFIENEDVSIAEMHKCADFFIKYKKGVEWRSILLDSVSDFSEYIFFPELKLRIAKVTPPKGYKSAFSFSWEQ